MAGQINSQSLVKTAIDGGLKHLASSRSAVQSVAGVLSGANEAVRDVGHGLDEIARATEQQRDSGSAVRAGIEDIARRPATATVPSAPPPTDHHWTPGGGTAAAGGRFRSSFGRAHRHRRRDDHARPL